jgi:hypothetical protein
MQRKWAVLMDKAKSKEQLEQFKNEFDALFDRLNKRFDQIGDKQDGLDENLKGYRNEFRDNAKKVEKQLDDIKEIFKKYNWIK